MCQIRIEGFSILELGLLGDDNFFAAYRIVSIIAIRRLDGTNPSVAGNHVVDRGKGKLLTLLLWAFLPIGFHQLLVEVRTCFLKIRLSNIKHIVNL